MEKSRRYSFEEAQDEALKLQNKILSGEAADYSDAERRLENPLNLEQIEKTIEVYSDSIKKIVKITYEKAKKNWGRESLSGELDGIKYRTLKTFRQGKQQHVIIVEFIVPDVGKFDLVCKKDGVLYKDDTENTFEKQQKYKILQEYLPKIFFEYSDIAAIEKIDGLELERFEQALGEENFFNQLVSESVKMVHDINHSDFYLNDVNFLSGHNVMYDLDKKHFRIFDIHSILPSDKKSEEKLFNFLNTICDISGEASQVVRDLSKAKFLIAFVKEYLRMYPEEALSYEGLNYEEVFPGESDYEEAFVKIKKKRGVRARYGSRIIMQKSGRVIIDPEVLSAIEENNVQKLKDLLSRKNSENRVTALEKSV